MTVVIDPFDTQDVIIGVELELDINISGNNIGEVTIKGMPEGFYYTWTGSACEMRGSSNRLSLDIQFTLEVIDDDETVTRNGIINVVPAAPIISPKSRQKIIQGVANTISILIANNPDIIEVTDMLYLGMRRHLTDDGIDITGDVPVDANFTVNEGVAIVTASNEGGEDIIEVEFDIMKPYFYGFQDWSVGHTNQDTIYEIQINAIEDDDDITSSYSFLLASDTRSRQQIAADADYFYYIHQFGSDHTDCYIRRIPINTLNGETVTGTDLTGSMTSQQGIGFRHGIAVDDDYVYVLNYATAGREIDVYNKDTGVFVRTYNLPESRNYRGIEIDGDNLVVNDRTTDSLYWFNKNTLNAQDASLIKTFHYPASFIITDITIFHEYVYMTDSSNDDVYRVDKNTEDRSSISDGEYDTYSVPASFRNLTGIAIVLV